MSQLDRPPQSFDISTAMAMIIPPTNTIRLLSSSLLHHSFWNIIAIVNHHHHCHLIIKCAHHQNQPPFHNHQIQVRFCVVVVDGRGQERGRPDPRFDPNSVLLILLPPGESGFPKIRPITIIAMYPRYMVFQRSF